MFKFFLPKDDNFFKLFQDISEVLVAVSKEFQKLISDLSQKSQALQIIECHEQEADLIVRSTFEKLHKTFITPFDRYDIHRFIKKLNDIIEAVLHASKRIKIYDIEELPPEIAEMAELVVNAAALLQNATQKIQKLDHIESTLKYCDEVNSLETRASSLLLKGVSKLFREEQDLRTLLKIKEIYEYTKIILNESQGAANIIRDIVLEYS